MDKLFLDANVLFSAAYHPDAGPRRLWALPEVSLVTSSYATEEAGRNLKAAQQRNDLEKLLASVEAVGLAIESEDHPALKGLPEKDRPILMAAMGARATHLITGDFSYFGPYYNRSIAGVLILPPASYLCYYFADSGR